MHHFHEIFSHPAKWGACSRIGVAATVGNSTLTEADAKPRFRAKIPTGCDIEGDVKKLGKHPTLEGADRSAKRAQQLRRFVIDSARAGGQVSAAARQNPAR